MASRRRLIGVAIVIVVLGSTLDAEAAGRGPRPSVQSARIDGGSDASTTEILGMTNQPTAVVRLDNLAEVRAVDLDFAKRRAAAVFGNIGARIIWIDEDSAVRSHVKAPFTLVVTGERLSSQASALIDALGFAEPTVGRAGIFWDRIAELNARSAQSIPGILGDVMAHELGHLLLAPPGHSAWGIMRSGVNVRVLPAGTFTKAQAREILVRLRGISSPVSDPR
jgi:hypothetical protein